MAIEPILALIDAEIERLTQVRSLLSSGGMGVSRLGQPNGKSVARKKHVLSPEARKRIADAQRKRWAAQKAKK